MEAERVERQRRSRLARFLSRLVREQPLGTVGGIIVLLLLWCGIFADILALYGMNEIHLIDRYAPPSWQYLLGAGCRSSWCWASPAASADREWRAVR